MRWWSPRRRRSIPRRDEAGARAFQLAVWHLHQFHQSGGSQRLGATRAFPRRRPACGHHADCPAWHDRALADFGLRWQQQLALPLGATGQPLAAEAGTLPVSSRHVRVAVVGAHLRGMPLNFQLTTRRAVFVEATHTAPRYRLYALANTQPQKPGIARATSGAAIEVELWDIPLARFGEFVAEIPARWASARWS